MLPLSRSLQHAPPLLGSSQGLRSVSWPRIISLRCLSYFWGSLRMALKMLVGAWPHCNQAQLHLQEPLMPCGLSFLNRDFPPAFFFSLSLFSYGHRLGFQSAVWIPNGEVKSVESFPDHLSCPLLPPHNLAVPKAPEKNLCCC